MLLCADKCRAQNRSTFRFESFKDDSAEINSASCICTEMSVAQSKCPYKTIDGIYFMLEKYSYTICVPEACYEITVSSNKKINEHFIAAILKIKEKLRNGDYDFTKN